MFCIYCGKEIPDGSECDCRRQTPASPAFDPAPTPAQNPADIQPPSYDGGNFTYYNNPQYGQYGNAYQPFSESRPLVSPKHQAIKDVFRSPLMLITCILFSADFILGLVDGFSMDIILILSTVGLWLVYAFSLKKDAPLKTVGLAFHSAVLMIQRVFLIILYVMLSVLIIILSFIPDEINSFIHDMNRFLSVNYDIDFLYDFSFSTVVLIILFVVCTCWFLFTLFYNISMRNNVRYLSDTAKETETRRRFGVFPGIVLILYFISQVGQAATYIFTANARNEFFTSLFNTLLKELETSSGWEFNYTFEFTTNYLYPVKMGVSAATMLFAAIITFWLRSKLNKAKEN